jgi:serine/threonine-protein kinase
MKTCPVCDSDFPDQHNTCPTDGAMLIVSHELAAGSLVRGKYRITRKLGQGGMGVVYQAEHMMLGGRVALKFLTGDLGKDPRFIKRFRMEARAAYQLRHPNIVEVTDLDQAEDGSLFIAMEYVEGPSLRAAIDEAPAGLEIARVLELGRGIASGLAEAHAHATVHRDIKPENILLATSRDGRELPKVLDFGIAAITESVTRTSVTRGLMLTPNYAAPEQWEEMPASEMDGRTDLYALGCVFYEMLTGRTPFHAHNTSGWMRQHLEETPRPPSELRPEVGDWPGLDGLTIRLLAKNRDDRPQDAELLSLLDDLLYSAGQERPELASEQRQERPATIIEEEWQRSGAVPTPLPQRVSLYPSQHRTQPPSQHRTQPPLQHLTQPPPQYLTQPPLQPSSPPPVPEPKPAAWKFPGWAWGALAILALAAVVAAVRLFAPHPQPEQTTVAGSQPAASPAQTQNVAQHEPQPSVAEEAKRASAVEFNAAAEKPANPPAGKPAQTNVPAPSAPKPNPAPANSQPSVQKPSGADLEQQAASLYKAGRASEAATLFDQACSAGSREACDNLGVMYASGKGVAKDDARAAALYATACNAGNALGCNNLGNIYASGRGVSKDNAQAASLYVKACADGNAVGCSNIGNYYRLGIGVEKDAAKARQFLDKGCKMGNQWGCDRLKEMQ